MISAKVIEHSSYEGRELISLETSAPKYLDAEVNTHRMLSINSSSDRAIPFKKMLEKQPFIPEDLRYNEKGMQGFQELSREDYRYTIDTLKELYNVTKKHLEVIQLGTSLHKQHLNRYLLGFSMQKKIMTGTKEEWDYFFGLRLHEAADPAIYTLAEEIHSAIHMSSPRELKKDQWHLPYITEDERSNHESLILCKASAARCARTSYDNFDGTKCVIDTDLGLFSRLADSKPQHLSPLDHQGKPLTSPKDTGFTHMFKDGTLASGNFKWWVQFRHYLLDNKGE